MRAIPMIQFFNEVIIFFICLLFITNCSQIEERFTYSQYILFKNLWKRNVDYNSDYINPIELRVSNKDRIKTKEEMKTTELAPKIDPELCLNIHPIVVFIHSAAKHKGKYFDRRVDSRNTWVSDVKKLKISVYFVIAISTNDEDNQQIKKESDQYKDIIQFSFIDSYHNLTLKAVSILRWINKNCKTSKYVLKTDDDVLIDFKQILNHLSDLSEGFHGFIFMDTTVHRHGIWSIPEKYYPQKNYPPFLKGDAYLMVGDIYSTLLKGIDEYKDYVIFIDDAFITGIMANKTAIKRYSFCYFQYQNDTYSYPKCEPKEPSKCIFCGLAVISNCESNRNQLWQTFIKSGERNVELKDCPNDSFSNFSNNSTLIYSKNYPWTVHLIFLIITVFSYYL